MGQFMTNNALNLLRGLASGVLPGGVETARKNGNTPADISSASFSQLFKSISRSGSGLPVSIAAGTGLELSSEQLSRIALAADKAQAQGASRALVMIDGQALQLDVGVRQVTGKVDLNSTDVLSGIDTVVWAGGSSGGAKDGTAASGGPSSLRFKELNGWNPSLLRVLSDGSAGTAGRQDDAAA
jgi:hypothetical protein